jgi:hypothetical protein
MATARFDYRGAEHEILVVPGFGTGCMGGLEAMRIVHSHRECSCWQSVRFSNPAAHYIVSKMYLFFLSFALAWSLALRRISAVGMNTSHFMSFAFGL